MVGRDLRPADKRAAEGNRTLDLVLTKDALYRLSYSSQLWYCFSKSSVGVLSRFILLPNFYVIKRVKGVEPS